MAEVKTQLLPFQPFDLAPSVNVSQVFTRLTLGQVHQSTVQNDYRSYVILATENDKKIQFQ